MLILESGRALIDDAGYLLGTVIANKRLSNGNRATIVDVGINLLFTSFWYEHEVYPAAPVSEHLEETTIFGPLCMNIDVLREAIEQGGTTLRDFLRENGKPGYFKQHLHAYGREGEPCHGCQAAIKKIVISGRSTFYCPKCQR